MSIRTGNTCTYIIGRMLFVLMGLKDVQLHRICVACRASKGKIPITAFTSRCIAFAFYQRLPQMGRINLTFLNFAKLRVPANRVRTTVLHLFQSCCQLFDDKDQNRCQ